MKLDPIRPSANSHVTYGSVKHRYSRTPTDHARVRGVEVDEVAEEAFRGNVVIPELEEKRETWEAPKPSVVRRMASALRKRLRL